SRHKSSPDHFGLGTLVSAGPRHLRHRDLHAHHPGDTHRRARRSSAQYRRTRPKRDSDILLIVGIVFALLLADRVGSIRLQILGFIGCAVGLLIAALSLHVGGTLSAVLLFAGFMLFSFMTNIGPNAMT